MIIDLSVPLDVDTPAYPGDPRIELTQDGSVNDDGYLGHSIKLGSHTGTHIDAPAHMIDGATTLGSLPLQTFIGNGKILYDMSVDAIDAAGITAGDIVLFNSGTSQRFHDPSYFTDYPVLPVAVAEYLVTKDVKLVGLDTCSADNVEGFPIHKILLGANIPIIENLTNLDALPMPGDDTASQPSSTSFTVYALPLKLDIDGAPARVIAITDDLSAGQNV